MCVIIIKKKVDQRDHPTSKQGQQGPRPAIATTTNNPGHRWTPPHRQPAKTTRLLGALPPVLERRDDEARQPPEAQRRERQGEEEPHERRQVLRLVDSGVRGRGPRRLGGEEAGADVHGDVVVVRGRRRWVRHSAEFA